MNGHQLKMWRKRKRLTQAQAAALVKYSARHWRDFEKGAATIPPDVIEYCKRDEIDMEQLDPKLLVIGWQRWLDSACVCRFPFESKCHGNGCKRKHASLCTQNELIQHHGWA